MIISFSGIDAGISLSQPLNVKPSLKGSSGAAMGAYASAVMGAISLPPSVSNVIVYVRAFSFIRNLSSETSSGRTSSVIHSNYIQNIFHNNIDILYKR
jgi:hypothetical protein